jgi:hypothetical protein
VSLALDPAWSPPDLSVSCEPQVESAIDRQGFFFYSFAEIISTALVNRDEQERAKGLTSGNKIVQRHSFS